MGLFTLNIFTIGLTCLVNMASLKENHDKLVFECFYHYSYLLFRTLIGHRLFQKKFNFRVLNFGCPFNRGKDN